MKKELALVYMVAGLSSRFGGNIKAFAKIGLNNETLLEYSLNQALPAGFTKIILIVGEKTKEPFKQKFGENYKGIPIYYALQTYDPARRQKPWGTCDAICSAKHLLDCPFIVCNGDDIYGKQTFKTLYNHLKNNFTDATVGYKLGTVLPEQGEVNRGIFKINTSSNAIYLEENFNLSKQNIKGRGLNEQSLCSMNIFALQKKTLEHLCKTVEKFKEKNKNDVKVECLLPQEINNLISQNKIIMKVYPTNEKWFGITCPEDVEFVNQKIKEQ